MAITIMSALLLSALAYLYIGFRQSKFTKSLADLLPIVFGRNARVDTTDEFRSSTVATTVSLATIVLAYFELAGHFGLYLLWTAVTTAIGMLLVSMAAPRIWEKLDTYKHRPSLHEFLGREYESEPVAFVASLCTSVGFLLIFATELIVGSRFLAALMPSIPEWTTIIFLCSVAFIYTFLGGFSAVIKTDQVQMKLIWALIFVLAGFYVYYIVTHGGFQANISRVPQGVLSLSSRPGLGFFLVGITLMNIPTHISNMAVWQRISGAQRPETVTKGLRSSIWSISMSWGLIVLLACFAYLIVTPKNSQTLLADLLLKIGTSPLGLIVVFVVVLGLYGAMLSTASTLLIAVTHTVSEDIVAKIYPESLQERIDSQQAFLRSRVILVVLAIAALCFVAGLQFLGFSIADLVFAIYGGALALFPPIIVALYKKPNRLPQLSSFATVAVTLGFLSGWGAAILGKLIQNSNLVFLSPTVGIAVSSVVLIVGVLVKQKGTCPKI